MIQVHKKGTHLNIAESDESDRSIVHLSLSMDHSRCMNHRCTMNLQSLILLLI